MSKLFAITKTPSLVEGVFFVIERMWDEDGNDSRSRTESVLLYQKKI